MTWLKRGLIGVGALLLLLMVIGLFAPRDANPPQAAKEAASEPPATSAPPKPASLEDRVRTVAKAAMGNADIDGLNFEGVQVSEDQDDNGNANDDVVVFVNYHLTELPIADDHMATLSASLYQRLFPLSPSIVHVAISFNGPITDAYGHTNERSYIDYGMERSTFAKINWAGFTANGLCAFLRSENSPEIDGVPANSCGLWPWISALGVEPPHH